MIGRFTIMATLRAALDLGINHFGESAICPAVESPLFVRPIASRVVTKRPRQHVALGCPAASGVERSPETRCPRYERLMEMESASRFGPATRASSAKQAQDPACEQDRTAPSRIERTIANWPPMGIAHDLEFVRIAAAGRLLRSLR